MQRSEGLFNQNYSFWIWLWLPFFQISPAKANAYQGQRDTTQSNLARTETGTRQHMALAHVTDSFVALLCIHTPGALCSRKTHLRWATPAAGTLVSPWHSRRSSLPRPRGRSCSLPPSRSAARLQLEPSSPGLVPSLQTTADGATPAQRWTGHSQSHHSLPAGGTGRVRAGVLRRGEHTENWGEIRKHKYCSWVPKHRLEIHFMRLHVHRDASSFTSFFRWR